MVSPVFHGCSGQVEAAVPVRSYKAGFGTAGMYPDHALPAQDAEITGIGRYPVTADIRHQPVEACGSRLIQPGFTPAYSPCCLIHSKYRLPSEHKCREQFGQTLKVGVDNDHGIAVCMVRAGGPGRPPCRTRLGLTGATRESRARNAWMIPFVASVLSSMT